MSVTRNTVGKVGKGLRRAVEMENGEVGRYRGVLGHSGWGEGSGPKDGSFYPSSPISNCVSSDKPFNLSVP